MKNFIKLFEDFMKEKFSLSDLPSFLENLHRSEEFESFLRKNSYDIEPGDLTLMELDEDFSKEYTAYIKDRFGESIEIWKVRVHYEDVYFLRVNNKIYSCNNSSGVNSIEDLDVIDFPDEHYKKKILDSIVQDYSFYERAFHTTVPKDFIERNRIDYFTSQQINNLW